ncbi:MAG: hypothetical protein Q7K28_03445 [Candidatus Wildermuthbacteria bacterium]|nr:hypothetical protein [Candidatus Wildermuthbacteria bacterium]
MRKAKVFALVCLAVIAMVFLVNTCAPKSSPPVPKDLVTTIGKDMVLVAENPRLYRYQDPSGITCFLATSPAGYGAAIACVK